MRQGLPAAGPEPAAAVAIGGTFPQPAVVLFGDKRPEALLRRPPRNRSKRATAAQRIVVFLTQIPRRVPPRQPAMLQMRGLAGAATPAGVVSSGSGDGGRPVQRVIRHRGHRLGQRLHQRHPLPAGESLGQDGAVARPLERLVQLRVDRPPLWRELQWCCSSAGTTAPMAADPPDRDCRCGRVCGRSDRTTPRCARARSAGRHSRERRARGRPSAARPGCPRWSRRSSCSRRHELESVTHTRKAEPINRHHRADDRVSARAHGAGVDGTMDGPRFGFSTFAVAG